MKYSSVFVSSYLFQYTYFSLLLIDCSIFWDCEVIYHLRRQHYTYELDIAKCSERFFLAIMAQAVIKCYRGYLERCIKMG